MPEYEFFLAEGAEGKFPAANRSIRSHAMRNALQMKSRGPDQADAQPPDVQSQDVVRNKAALRGRFRLPGRPGRKKRRPEPDEEVLESSDDQGPTQVRVHRLDCVCKY